jgi:uncharacterized protein
MLNSCGKLNAERSNASFLFKSRGNNSYLYDRNNKKTLMLHPVMAHLAGILTGGESLSQWMKEWKDERLHLEGYGTFSRREVEYYYRKIQVLEKNGYFKLDTNGAQLTARMTPEIVKNSLANLRQILFETTDLCGLECEYCGYGKYYDNYDKRQAIHMEEGFVRNTLDFLKNYLNSNRNQSRNRNLYISFYGGEPLMNFSLVRETVNYSRQLDWKNNNIAYSMTTNGVLLEKYMDFLAEHRFNLLISLDGDEKANSYRVFKNKKPAYKEILRNVTALKEKYPDYFRDYVNFNAVLHNKNTVDGIYNYFKKNFGKYPSIGELNTAGIREDRREEFRQLYVNSNESLYNSEDYRTIERDMFIKLDNIQAISTFLHQYNDFTFRDYDELIYGNKNKNHQCRFPSGTCVPFSKKLFVTVQGKILACERIGQRFALGQVTKKEFFIDFQRVADDYNRWFDKIRKLCEQCARAEHCTQCMFLLDLEGKKTMCGGFTDNQTLADNFAGMAGYFEKNRDIYTRLLKETVID